MENYRNVAVYNGATFDMGDATPEAFLDLALVPNYPDLRGARFTLEVDDVRQERRYVYAKRAGEKGLGNQ